jgi:D-sedoheptulose 7-phosphate isomerase
VKEYIVKHIADSIDVKKAILHNEILLSQIETAARVIIKAYENHNKTMIAGNGGSAADAQHIAGEFVSRFYFDRPGLASVALTTDTSILTAIGNDYGYERVFARQIEANGVCGDIFIGISTSGNSKNILEAIHAAKDKKIFVIGLTGDTGGLMADMCDICICIPSLETPRIQESHILVGHILCAIVEKAIFSKGV